MDPSNRQHGFVIRPSPAVPAVVLALSLLFGSFAGKYAHGKNLTWLKCSLPVMGILAFASPTPVGLIGAGFTAGAYVSCLKKYFYEDQTNNNEKDLTLCGEVLRVSPGLHGNTDVIVRITETLSIGVEKVRFAMDLSLKGKHHPVPGGRIRMRAQPVNPYRSRILGNIVHGRLAGHALVEDHRSFFSLKGPRRRLDLVFRSGNDSVTGLLEAITLGRKWEVGPSMRNILRRTGTYHFMAISGVHIGSAIIIPIVMVNALLTFLRKDGAGWEKILPIIAGLLTLSVYLSLTGLSTSALRAGIFVIFYWAAVIAGRYPHPFTVLGWCVASIVCMAPGDQPNMALLLSACAVTGILLSSACPCRPGLKILHVTMGAILFTLPLSVWCAGGISTVAPVCNLFAGLVFGFVLIPLAVFIDLLACLVTHPWELPVAVWSSLAEPLMVVLGWFSDLPAAFLVLSQSGCLVATVAALTALIIWKAMDFKPRAGIVLFLAVMAAALGFERARGYLLKSETVLCFPRVGQADAAILRGGGRTVLIDCAGAGRLGRMTNLERRLVKMGVNKINGLFLTHAHPDHIGGFRELTGRWRIDVLYIPEFERDPGRWSEVTESLQRGTRVVSLKEEDVIRVGPFSFLVLGLPVEHWEDCGENARSLQMYLKWDDTTALFTGDAPWQQVLPSLERIAHLELIKIPHHGSKTGFPPDGLESTVSRLRRKGSLTAVFPSPPPGTAALPSKEVVEWFKKQKVRCLFTGREGGLIFRTVEKKRVPVF